jgi:hypothetical protein
VMVANNEYQHENWSSLAGTPEHPSSPIADADALATILLEKYQFEAILTVQNATLEQMNATLADLTQHQEPAERILFFYAGHGDFDATQKKAYLVPTDAQGSQRKTQLSASHFSNQMNTMQSEHILTIIDACYGGSFVLDHDKVESSNLKIPSSTGNLLKSRSKTAWSRGAGVGKKVPKDSTTVDNASDSRQKEVISSNRPEPKDLETSEFLQAREVMSSGQRVEVPNASDFIRALLAELRQNTDSKLAARTLFERLKPAVMTKGLVPQHGILPSAGSDGGDFIFRKK